MKFRFDALARRQYGLITHAQLLEHADKHHIRTLRTNGALIPVARSLYRVHGAPTSWEQQALATVLGGPSGALLSHGAAGRLWQLLGCGDAAVEITVPRTKSRRTPGAVTHAKDLDADERARQRDIPVTSVARTIIDLAASRTAAQLERIIDDAAQRRLVTPYSVLVALQKKGTAGRAGAGTLRRVLRDRVEVCLVANSQLQRDVVRTLIRNGISGFEEEYRMAVGGRSRYIDVAWPEYRVALEVDGYAVHAQRAVFDDDRVRNNLLAAEGWIVLHVTSNTSNDHLLSAVRGALSRRQSKVLAKVGAFDVDY